MFVSQRRYSPDVLAFAFHLMCLSKTVNEMVREKLLILLNTSYLRRLSSGFRTDDSFQDLSAHAGYLKNKAGRLALHERRVILLLGEIHVNQACTYKGCKVVGTAINAVENEVSRIKTFMIRS